MRIVAAALFVCGFSFPAHAQRGQFFTVMVRSGNEIVKVLVEKRADLTVGIVSGAVVTAIDKSLSSLFEGDKSTAPKELWIMNCSALNANLATCKDSVKLPGEVPLAPDDVRIRNALGGAQTSLLFPKNNPQTTFKAPPAPAVSDRAIVEVTFWWSIQSSKFVADYEDYLKRFPAGEFAEIAKRRIAELKAPPPEGGAQSPCSRDGRVVAEPVQRLYDALEARSAALYADQWFENASYRSYDGMVRLSKYELVAERRFLFTKWVDVRISNLHLTVSVDSDGLAVARSTYNFFARDVHGRIEDVYEVESFLLACSTRGEWKILDNVYYPN